MDNNFLFNFVLALLFGMLTSYLAQARGRNPLVWFFIGAGFGVFGILALFFFPVEKEEPKKAFVDEITVVPEPVLPDRWFYLDEQHAQYGPVTLAALQVLWKEKKISASTMVWCEGMQEWKRVGELESLLKRLNK